MKRARRSKISVKPGVSPAVDTVAPASSVMNYVSASMVRWDDNGRIKLIPPWDNLLLSNDQITVSTWIPQSTSYPGYGYKCLHGVVTWIFSYYDSTNSRVVTLFGTSLNLYAGYDIESNSSNSQSEIDTFACITPLQASTTAIANSLATYYKTLANNPIATTSGSASIVITDTSTKVRAGDSVTLSGAADTNGITAANINGARTVTAQTTNSFTVTAGASASSTGSGGGASVVLATGIISVTAAAHGLTEGARVQLESAATTGGVTDTLINKKFNIRNVAAGSFDVYTTGTATSSVSGGGGASTTYRKPVALTAPFSGGHPVWSGGLFGTVPVFTPGGGGKLYEWDGTLTTDPTAVTNSPSANDLCFVTDNIIVTARNRTLTWSDQGVRTDWTAGASDQAGTDDIENSDPFIGHAHLRGVNLLFTRTQVWTMRYIGPPYVFDIEQIYGADGIAGPKSVREYGGVLYWMGHKNFYRWYGGQVEPIPGNTLYDYIFTQEYPAGVDWVLSANARYMTACDVRGREGEIWWYPINGYTSGASAPYTPLFTDAVVYSVSKGWWTTHANCNVTACGEGRTLEYEINGSIDGSLWVAERLQSNAAVSNPGFGANTWAWYAHTHYGKIGNGDNVQQITKLIPSVSNETTYNYKIRTVLTPTQITSAGYREVSDTDLDQTTGEISVRISGRYRQYIWSGSTWNDPSFVNQFGDWYEEVKLRGTR